MGHTPKREGGKRRLLLLLSLAGMLPTRYRSYKHRQTSNQSNKSLGEIIICIDIQYPQRNYNNTNALLIFCTRLEPVLQLMHDESAVPCRVMSFKIEHFYCEPLNNKSNLIMGKSDLCFVTLKSGRPVATSYAEMERLIIIIDIYYNRSSTTTEKIVVEPNNRFMQKFMVYRQVQYFKQFYYNTKKNLTFLFPKGGINQSK